MQFNSSYKLLYICLFIAVCFSCIAYADTTEAVIEKLLNAKREAQCFQEELFAEANHIHDELISQAIQTPSPLPLIISSAQAFQNRDFVQMLRDGLAVISNINAAQNMNAAQEDLLTDVISFIEDEKARESYQSRLEKLSSARIGHDKKAEKIFTDLQNYITEVDPELQEFSFSVSSDQVSSWIDDLETFIRNNPFSLKSHSFSSVENSLSELKIVLESMDSIGEELTVLESELRAQ